MAVTASQTNLAGLPRRLVQDGLISEEQLLEATEAAKKEKLPLVAFLVNEELADARAIAVAASHEFGVPLLDLDALDDDLEVERGAKTVTIPIDGATRAELYASLRDLHIHRTEGLVARPLLYAPE